MIRKRFSLSILKTLGGLGAIALGSILVLSWKTHSSHIISAAPYFLVLLCPLMHLLMHKKHKKH